MTAERVLEAAAVEVDETEIRVVALLGIEVDKGWVLTVDVLEMTLELDEGMTGALDDEAGRTIALTTRLGVATEAEVDVGTAKSTASLAALGLPPHDLWVHVREEGVEAGVDEDAGAEVVIADGFDV